MRNSANRGLTSAGVAIVVLILAVMVASIEYTSSSQQMSDQVATQNSQIALLQKQIQHLASQLNGGRNSPGNVTLPVMNQEPTTRVITETWYLSPSAHQDRFDPSFIVVNQGDTVRLTFIDNDTVAHDFVIGPAYNIIVNATVPGLINDLTGQKFTTNATNNTPGVFVSGAPGGVSAAFNFVAKHPGIYEFVCTYHVQVGMIGYLVVLPNLAYTKHTTTTATSAIGNGIPVSITSGAGVYPNTGFSPDNMVLVLGLNSTVTWTNNDSQPHTVTETRGVFDSGFLAPADKFAFSFNTVGVYHYQCTYHQWMSGTITVKPEK